MRRCAFPFLVSLLLLGWAGPGLAAEGILLEAESMQPAPPDAGWKPTNHYTGWYEKVPSEVVKEWAEGPRASEEPRVKARGEGDAEASPTTSNAGSRVRSRPKPRIRFLHSLSGQKMLCGSGGPPGQARGEIEVPETANYHLWIRYLDLIRYRGPFEVIVRQGGRERARRIFDQVSMRTSAAGKAKWGRGYACFVWASLAVTLEAGKAQIAVDKLPPVTTTRVSRTLDCFVLASDPDYVPSVHDFVPPLYLRVVMGRGHRKPCFIHIFGRRPPPPHYIAHHNLTQAGLSPGPYGGILGKNARDADVQLTSHEATPWVDIAPLLAIQGLNRVLLTAIRTYNRPLERADFTVEVATEPSRKHRIRSYRRKGQGAGLMLTVDLTRRDKIRRDLDWAEETLAWARALPPPDGRRPRRFPVLTGCTVSPQTYASDVVADEIETLSRLGFSGLEPERAYLDAGFVHPKASYYVFHLRKHDCLHQPKKDDIEKALRHRADVLKKEGAAKHLTFFSLMDEPGSMTFAHIARCPVCRKRFVDHVRALGLGPKDVGKTTWEEVLPTADREKEPRLFYATARFRSRALADYLALGTRILDDALPGVPTTCNFAESLTYSGNLLLRGVDWFEILGRRAITCGWTEDWLNTSSTFQLCGYRADFLRSACRGADLPMGMLDVLEGRSGWDIQAKGVTEIGHGARALLEFTYGPTYAMSSDPVSHRADLQPALQHLNHAIGKIEDDLLAAHVPPSPIALHYSHATDIWTLDETWSVFGKERMGIYLLLRHLGYPIDIVTEADLVGGDLEKRRFLVLGGSHVKRDAAAKLAAWVAKGGHLYLGPGTGTFDEFHERLDLMETFGFETEPLDVTQTCGRGQYEFPLLRVLDRVDGGTGLLDVVCAKGALTTRDEDVTADDAGVLGPVEVLARFKDNAPAVLARTYGGGRVVASAFFVGLGYTRSGTLRRKALWEEDATAKARTFNPPSFDAAYRAFFGGVVTAAKVVRRCTTSHPLVEASVLAMPRGFVIALSNWSGIPQEGLEVEVRIDRPLRKVLPAGLALKDVREAEGAVHIRVDLDAAGFLVVRTR